MTDPELAKHRDWQRRGTELLLGALDRLPDAALAEPSRLPGWTRAHLLAHLARNGDALRNLLTWARTGVETPMYSSPQARDSDIERTAALPPVELRADLAESIAALDADMAALTEAGWRGQARTRQGRLITGADVPWMRCREVWVHTVDLDAGVEFADLPVEIGVALLSDACGFAAAGPADVRIVATDADFAATLGDGAVEVALPLAELLGWVLGRSVRPELPELPRWL
ncbi:MAG TPA: maleylpyruvate isomerase family mycothiol-dependent enzyme [Jatrophihabitans sp.]|nr:maleylpyruvate isomerase family mycothiol-dependent enzyme [Jatrophihabitans sp.]